MTMAMVRKGRAHAFRAAGSSVRPYCSICWRRAFGPQHQVDEVTVLRALSMHLPTAPMSLLEQRAAALEGRSRGYSAQNIALRMLRTTDDVTPTRAQVAVRERTVNRYLTHYTQVARLHHPHLYPVGKDENS